MFILLTISIILMAAAGASEAVMDKIQFHWHKSIFNYDPKRYPEIFWNPYHSWKNKYADSTWTTPKFPGSTSIFVALTDAWHLFKSIRTALIFISILLSMISMYVYKLDIDVVWWSIIVTSTLRIVYGLSFTLFYRKVLHFKATFDHPSGGNTPSNEVNSDWNKKVNGEI